MFRLISKLIFKILGWKVVGKYPTEGVKKSILIALPHTSNWDFPLGILTRSIIGANVTFLGKDSLFKPPFGWIFRLLKGVPVDRSKSNNFVDTVVKIYDSREELHVVIAPEGTRTRVEELKTGFYYIALGAKIPIVMVRFDYGNKEARFSEPFYPTGDKDKDIEQIAAYYKGIKGKIPEYGWRYP